MATEVEITGIAAGGDGVGRLEDGRAVFVTGALPTERVTVAITEDKDRFARAALVDVVSASTARIEPPCPLVFVGCGGCGWQHVEHGAQRELKATIVTDALTRIGKLTDLPPINQGPDLAATGYRTTVRAAVIEDRAALRMHHEHDLVDLSDEGCLVAHPFVDDILRHGRFPTTNEVTVRAGAASGDRLVLVDPSANLTELDNCRDDANITLVSTQDLRARKRVWFHETVADRSWRISADSFFQTRTDGANALVDLVAAAAAPALGAATKPRLVDLYGGVGLLGGAVAARHTSDVRLQLVEADRSAASDARTNLADLDAKIIAVDVRKWQPTKADVVIADPSRHGLGREVVDRVAATNAARIVLVSCDAGSLGRDAGLLDRDGYRLEAITLLDLFPHTPHVEVVTTWVSRRTTPA